MMRQFFICIVIISLFIFHNVFGETNNTVDFYHEVNTDETLFISPVGCQGIIRRTQERKININARLAEVLQTIANTMPADEIEKRSRVQHRGRFSN